MIKIDNIIIYKDKEKIISIAPFLLDFLQNFKRNYIKISSNELQILLDSAFSEGIDTDEIKKYSVISSSQVIPISKDGYIQILDQYDFFDDVLYFLSEIYSVTDSIQELKEMDLEKAIQEIYQEEYSLDCYVHIFNQSYFNVSGYIRIIKDNFLYVFFFKFLD